jgi:hypothetical protein
MLNVSSCYHTMTVDLQRPKKRVSLEATTQQQSKLAETPHNKPLWIWNVQEHKQEDVITNGLCCFNHIIGLPSYN